MPYPTGRDSNAGLRVPRPPFFFDRSKKKGGKRKPPRVGSPWEPPQGGQKESFPAAGPPRSAPEERPGRSRADSLENRTLHAHLIKIFPAFFAEPKFSFTENWIGGTGKHLLSQDAALFPIRRWPDWGVWGFIPSGARVGAPRKRCL